MDWPENKKFAFTIFDDTDKAKLEDLEPLYQFLHELGFRTTKSVWIFNSDEEDVAYPGDTCENPDYLSWLRDLQSKGFEIGLHNVAPISSKRERIKEGLDLFYSYFKKNPIVFTNHMSNLENIYWGAKRLNFFLPRVVYKIATIGKLRHFYGDDESSPYFWGDLCKERVRYVRNFVFNEINTLKVCPIMPYHDPSKPYVNYWFSSSDGRDIERFLQLLSKIDTLEKEKGACIVYTHFANGFVHNGKIDQRFVKAMQSLSKRKGWFVPVNTLLDWLKDNKSGSSSQFYSTLFKMEVRWISERIFAGGSH